jgi:predicted nucleic acid-binding protein
MAAFKRPSVPLLNSSASFIREWNEGDIFIWLMTEEILEEYKSVLMRRQVRRSVIGRIINILRQQAVFVTISHPVTVSPDPGDEPFCACAEQGDADFIVTLNPKDFPQALLSAHVIGPEDPIPTTGRKKKPRKA